MWELILPLLGFLAAIVAVMTGVGGGVFFVPLLTLAYGLVPAHAVGTSLLVIVFSGLSASLGYAKQKKIFFRTGLLLAVATVPGTVVGAFLTSILSSDVLGLIFGVFLSIVAIRIISVSKVFRKRKAEQVNLKVVESEHELFENKTRFAMGFGLSFFAGLVSSLLGIGGGVLLVPIMALVMLMPIHVVVATSMFTMIFTSLSGVAQHYTLGNIDFSYALLLAVGAIVGAQVGAWLCKRISGESLRIIFAVVLIIVSVQMIIKFI